ncbi:MAG: CHC2 zinc finger domain-containing protein [Alistipes sp.]|nr:CHC2 zinc finger domain-containing protein [Alistipes sp.]
MTIFEKVKELVDVPTAARYYGIEVRRDNMCLCPFHNERTPSCKLYEKNYHCFGSQVHGDVIGLVQELFGLSPIEAVRQLNSDFGLCLNVDKPPDRADIQRIEKQGAERKAYEQWKHHAFDVLNKYLWLMRDYAEMYVPQSPDDIPDSRFVYSQHHLSYAEYIADEFLLADKEEKLAMREEIDHIEQETERLKRQ